MRHSQGATKAKKALPSPDSISHTHTSRHLAGSLHHLCSLRQSQATYGTKKKKRNDTMSGQKRGNLFLFFLSSKLSPSAGLCVSMWPQIWGLPADQACNACVIRQSGGVHTHSWRDKGITRPNIQSHTCAPSTRPVPKTRVRPPDTPGEKSCPCVCVWSFEGFEAKKKKRNMGLCNVSHDEH